MAVVENDYTFGMFWDLQLSFGVLSIEWARAGHEPGVGVLRAR